MKPVWKKKELPSQASVDALQSSLKTNPTLVNLLVQRGITSFDSAKAFFRPDLDDLHDPFLMKDMEVAVERINKAIEQGEKVMVYGDYDVDGTTSVSLVYSFFKNRFEHVEFYIPDRYTEGYGISKQGIDHAASEGIGLIIALDCGIRSVDLIAYANDKNIDFIICDHHLPGNKIPDAVAVLDPKRADCEYPFKELCGCGVGFKLLQAFLIFHQQPEVELYQYLDLLAISIAADIVPIVGENRILAFHGLKQINTAPRLPMEIIKDVGIKKPELTISDVVFFIGPRINAAGRMKHAHEAVRFLIADEMETAMDALTQLNNFNTKRQSVDKTITDEILNNIGDLSNQYSMVFKKEDWHKGVIGIVASRIVEAVFRPTIVFTKSNGYYTGSARSIPGFDIHEALVQCSQYIEQFGGHMYAAGLSILPENMEAFEMAFEKYAQTQLKGRDLKPELWYDLEIDATELNNSFYKLLKQMGPFGPENPSPVFRVNGLSDTGYARKIGKDQSHLKMNINGGENHPLGAIGFSLGHYFDDIKKADTFDACFSLEENYFNGNYSLQMVLKDLIFND